MAMDDNESCGSRTVETASSKQSRHERQRFEVYTEVLSRLQDLDRQEVKLPGFEDQLWHHFNRLPARYAMDVNVERAEDVLTHKRLLLLAEDPDNRPAFDVRLVQVHPSGAENDLDSAHSDSLMREDAQSHTFESNRRGIHPPPTFGSSSNLEALGVQSSGAHVDDVERDINSIFQTSRPMHEITFSTVDKPKLLSQLTSLLSDIGLNIEEAHAFSTTDGFSLDVFVVAGWPYEETELLKSKLQKEIKMAKEQPSSEQHVPPMTENYERGNPSISEYVKIPTDEIDVWEIDPRQLRFGNRIASGAFGDLYKGTYCSQEVAIKVLKPERVNIDMLKEFSQEVFIMRKIRHKNVVQFLGACTKPPNLCIVTEFMCKGSVHSFLHKQKSTFKLSTIIRVAMDVSKGMNYLHQNNIIHRDLKTANLLMDEHEVVKVADFGVSRVVSQTGVMTAETGTYRWMAPEVIEHKLYDHKADVFSFGIVLWELLTREIPYSDLTPLQAAIGVVQQGLRPAIPKHTHPKLVELLEKCWQQDPTHRPNFSQILENLQRIAKEVVDEVEDRQKDKSIGGFFSSLRKGHH